MPEAQRAQGPAQPPGQRPARRCFSLRGRKERVWVRVCEPLELREVKSREASCFLFKV